MRNFLILTIVFLMIGSFGWSTDLILKAGKISKLPYKTDFVAGFGLDFSLLPSSAFKNLKGKFSFLIANPEWQNWQNAAWVKSNQILFDFGLSYQFSFRVKEVRLEPFFGGGAGYMLASLGWQDYSYYYYDYPTYYSLESRNSFITYLGAGLKIFLTKKIFLSPEIKIYQPKDGKRMTAFLIGIGYRMSPGKKDSKL